KLILFTETPKYMTQVIVESSESKKLMHVCEKDILGFDHALLGAKLLGKWKLPDEIVTSVYYHHMPSISKGDILNASVVHIADIIAHSLQYGFSGEKFVPALNDKAWAILNLETEVISGVIEQANIQYNDAVKYILG
ncbi:MAG: HDOD domain-containing protein, partial [Gammaproteobacteria bacterium]|nr:HDOD domain-containing protein [Gammaproteobacteria bacterium]